MEINKILKLAAEALASDVHLVFNQEPIFRIDGTLKSINEVLNNNIYAKLNDKNLESFIDTLLSKESKNLFFQFKDLDLSYQLDNFRFRLNFSFEKGHIKIVARVISDEEQNMTTLGLPEITKDLLNKKQGLILVTGPTGCGKSTTLAAMINYINNRQKVKIITLEDPIEYVFSSKKSLISQRQLGTDVSSFSSGLKHVLRQDPNVVMIGEMRDLETIATALTIAETGHLVLATLHTNSSAQTIDRIIDVFPPHQQQQVKAQLSFTLAAIISQRLLPKKDGGRVAAREILINNQAIANMIREGKIAQLKNAIETGSSEGMISLDKSIFDLYKQGLIDEETAINYLEGNRCIDLIKRMD